MIRVYKKKTIPKAVDVIRMNDVFFNQNTAEMLDERARDIIRRIDKSEMIEKYTITSRFDGTALNIDRLSTGCKTTLNIMYNLDKIFDISECGENALEVIYSLDEGQIYCDYPMIAFNMQEVEIEDVDGVRAISDYEELREWWKNED
ncbi:DUF4869 domain-containing protein [Butyrivibrio sp. AE2032]|uniref:DUF4869 domain-containing protein n=1 Tax=Butyrivibrio sp. AE2032 TaxID=1458463 RepID=UPI00054F5FD9|nr:DUF4869 domain-containing protein [Butyrivibrio sp. AE2032]